MFEMKFTRIFIFIWMQYVLSHIYQIFHVCLPCMLYTFYHQNTNKKFEIKKTLFWFSISSFSLCDDDAMCTMWNVAQMLIGCSIKTSVFPAPTIIYHPKCFIMYVVRWNLHDIQMPLLSLPTQKFPIRPHFVRHQKISSYW